MKITLKIGSTTYQADLKKPLDLSIPLGADKNNLSAWYVDPVQIESVKTDHFTGSVKDGGSVNFRNIRFNPHGNGTHTECVGHIAKKVYSVNQALTQFFFPAELISVKPVKKPNGDQIIKWEQIQAIRNYLKAEAIIIRTLPNETAKKKQQYSNTNPPFLEAEVMSELIKQGIKHLLIDLPSVDKEVDQGVLAAHHAFWEHPENTNLERTITELIYVPNAVKDGLYLLNLQIASFENDASPSKPVLFALSTTKT